MFHIFSTQPQKLTKSCSEFTEEFSFDWLSSLGEKKAVTRSVETFN